MNVKKCDFCGKYIEDIKEISSVLFPSHWCGDDCGKSAGSYQGTLFNEFDICKPCYNNMIKTLYGGAMKEISIYMLYRDEEEIGVFHSKKSIYKYIRDWEESYFNGDERDSSYRPAWRYKVIEEE